MGARKNVRIGVLLAALTAAGCAGDPGAEADLTADGADLEVEAQLAEQVTVRRPIVFVAGLMEDKRTVAPLVNWLKNKGFDVTVYVPPGLGIGDINFYATAVGDVVEDVRERTGAPKVDLIGHSQGGVTARRYTQLPQPNGGPAPVHTLVSLGSPQQGTDYGALVSLLAAAGAFDKLEGAKQLIVNSKFLIEMNKKSDPTPGDTRFVAIGTKLDVVTTPVARSGIPGGENVVVQEACPGRNIGHFGLLNDEWVAQTVASVLAGGPPQADCALRPLGGPI